MTDVGEDPGNGLRIGQNGDEGEGRLAGWTDQGEDFIDASQEGDPLGRLGRGGVGWSGCWRLGFGVRGRGGCREGKAGSVDLSGEGIVLVGPLGNQGPQGGVGGKDAVVAVAVDPGWGEDLGQTIQELEGREAECGAAGRIGPGEEVENLVGAAVEEVKAIESKRWRRQELHETQSAWSLPRP